MRGNLQTINTCSTLFIKVPLENEKGGEEKPKFHVDDQVRISRAKGFFEKGYTANWTEEVYKVVEVQPTLPWTYKLEDTRGEKVNGTFYEYELQAVATPETYRIKKTLKRHTTPEGTNEVYVKWLGYNKDFNQWIPESDIV